MHARSVLFIVSVCLCAALFGWIGSLVFRAPDVAGGVTGSEFSMAAKGPRLAFVTPMVDLGNRKGKVQQSFQLRNQGTALATIGRIVPSCSCTMVSSLPKVLPAGESCEMQVEVNLDRQPPGSHRYAIKVEYDDGTPGIARAEFVVQNVPDLHITPSELTLKGLAGESLQGSIALIWYKEEPLTISKVMTSSSRIQGHLRDTSRLALSGWKYVIEVQATGEDLPPGSYQESLVISTGAPDHAEVNIPVTLRLADRIQVSPASLVLRRSVDNSSATYLGQFIISDLKGQECELASLACDSEDFTLSIAHSTPSRKIVSVAARSRLGSGSAPAGKITIRTKQTGQQEFTIPVSCLAN